MKQDEAAQSLSKIQRKLLKQLAAEVLSDKKLQKNSQNKEESNDVPTTSQT